MRLFGRLPFDIWLEGMLLRACRTKHLDDSIRASRDAILERVQADMAEAVWRARVEESERYLNQMIESNALLSKSVVRARLQDLAEKDR